MRLMNGGSGPERGGKVLVVSVDDGLFACHLDWVEAVYQGTALPVHAIRNGSGRARPFVLHGQEAAVVIDLRELLGLQEVLGAVRRAGHLLVRSGTALVALPIDACVGVRELDLGRHAPVPTRLRRDGGLPLGHMLELDGRLLTVLDPNRLLDGSLRAALAPLQAKARAFQDRQARIEQLWQEIRREASAEQVRAFARLCSRSGRGRTAGAARQVLLHMDENGHAAPAHGADAVDRLVCELLRRARARSSGALLVDLADGDGGEIVLAAGRVVDARCGGIDGRTAFTRLLGAPARAPRFMEGIDWSGPERITESTVALTIAALESLPAERAARAR
jgi:hypothetical protein